MNQTHSLPVDNFRRFTPICSSVLLSIILIFIFQEEITWFMFGIFGIAIICSGLFFYALYKKVTIDTATLTNEGIDVFTRGNWYSIHFKKIRSINKVVNHGFEFNLKYSISYIISLNEKFPFGDSISLKYPIVEIEPDEVSVLKQRWLESLQNDSEDLT